MLTYVRLFLLLCVCSVLPYDECPKRGKCQSRARVSRVRPVMRGTDRRREPSRDRGSRREGSAGRSPIRRDPRETAEECGTQLAESPWPDFHTRANQRRPRGAHRQRTLGAGEHVEARGWGEVGRRGTRPTNQPIPRCNRREDHDIPAGEVGREEEQGTSLYSTNHPANRPLSKQR